MNQFEDRLDAAFDAARSAADKLPNADQIAKAREQFLLDARDVSQAEVIRHRDQGSATPTLTLVEGEPRMRSFYARHSRLIAALIGVIIAGGFWTSPPLRAFAQSVIDIFIPIGTDKQDHLVYVGADSEVRASVAEDPNAPEEAYANPYSLTIEEVAAQTDFAIFTPTVIPEEYEFAGALYQPNNRLAMMTYECGELGYPLTLIQQQSNAPLETIEVGASAVIINVPIRETSGQYVRGAWMALFDEERPYEEGNPENTITIPRGWENTSDWQELKWQEAGLDMTVSSGGSIGIQLAADHPCALTEEDFAAVAQGLQLGS